MTAKEWLDVMKQAADYNPAMTKLIEKYGEMLLEEQNVANKNFIKLDGSGSLPTDLIELQNQWLEDGDEFEGKEVEGRYAKIYVSRKELNFVHKQQRRQ